MRHFIRGAVIALALLAPAWAGATPSLQSIAAALQAGRATDAETMATQMLANRSSVPLENTYLLLDRGLAREQLHRRKEAVSDFTAAIDSKTLPPAELARAVFDRGVILDELGRTEEAIADYSHAILLEPRYAAALNNRGNAYRRTARYVLARTDYEAALAAGDDEPEYPLYGLGRIAEVLDDPVSAKGYYQRALAANGMFRPASDRLTSLEPLPVDGGYKLRAPATAVGHTADDTPQADDLVSSQTQPVALHKPAVESATAGLELRPAILDSSVHAAPVRTASPVADQHVGTSSTDEGGLVQLGAWRNQGDAALGWNRLALDAGELLDGATPDIIEADVPGKGHFWRLRTRAPTGIGADAFCTQLRAKGLNCIAVRS